jgi:hypothetical protein
MFFQSLSVLLQSTHFNAPDGSKNGKCIKNGLNTLFPWTLQLRVEKQQMIMTEIQIVGHAPNCISIRP